MKKEIQSLLDNLLLNTNHNFNSNYNYNNKNLPRVTSILSQTIHEDYLLQWANSIGLYQRKKYKDELDKASYIGTITHNSIEYFILNNTNINNIINSIYNIPPIIEYNDILYKNSITTYSIGNTIKYTNKLKIINYIPNNNNINPLQNNNPKPPNSNQITNKSSKTLINNTTNKQSNIGSLLETKECIEKSNNYQFNGNYSYSNRNSYDNNKINNVTSIEITNNNASISTNNNNKSSNNTISSNSLTYSYREKDLFNERLSNSMDIRNNEVNNAKLETKTYREKDLMDNNERNPYIEKDLYTINNIDYAREGSFTVEKIYDVNSNMLIEKIPNRIMYDNISNAFNSFILWYKELLCNASVEILYSEMSLACPYYGGTCDLIIKINGKVYLLDFKTSNHVGYKYYLQLSAYKYILEEYMGIQVDGFIILQLDKKCVAYEEYVLDFSNKEHRIFVEECEETFMALVYAYYKRIHIEKLYSNIKK